MSASGTLRRYAIAQQNRAAAGSAAIEITPVRGNIYVLSGAGGNIVVSVGRDGVFLVDSGLEQNIAAVLEKIAELQKMADYKRSAAERFAAEGRQSTVLEPYYRAEPAKPIRHIANTTFDPAHIGGNLKLRAASRNVYRRQRGERDRRRQ